jgi:hypothetical protein
LGRGFAAVPAGATVRPACVDARLVDAMLPGMTGPDLLCRFD